MATRRRGTHRTTQARFEQQRNVELAEVQRLEAEAKRRAAEKERRLAQERLRMQQEEEVMEKVAARGFAKNFLSDLHSRCVRPAGARCAAAVSRCRRSDSRDMTVTV